MVFGDEGPLDTGDKIASIVGGAIALLSLLHAPKTAEIHDQRVRDVDDSVLDFAVGALTVRVASQWEAEADRRGLLRPEPLRIPWHCVDGSVAASPDTVLGRLPRAKRIRLRLVGDVTTLADVVRALPARQLVVLGPSASGKTSAAILLLLDLLRQRSSTEPVPILIHAAEWDPATASFREWMARRLIADYPHAFPGGWKGPAVATRLVEQGLVMPIIDGLDRMGMERESAESRRAHLLVELSSGAADQPFVLVSRTAEYEATVRRTGTALGRALVLRLAPVPAREVAIHLTAGQVDSEQRWGSVITRLREQPSGILATALSSPLMSSLARIVYTRPERDPGELLDWAESGRLQTCLLSEYVTATYDDHRVLTAEPLSETYTEDQARQWLSVLAAALTRSGTRRFNPWAPVDVARWPKAGRQIVLVVIIVLLITIGTVTPQHILGAEGLVFGIAVGLWGFVMTCFTALLLVMRRPSGPVDPFRWQITPRRILDGALEGAFIALFMIFVYPLMLVICGNSGLVMSQVCELVSRYSLTVVLLAVVACAATGVLVGSVVHGNLAGPVLDSTRQTPASALRHDARAALTHLPAPVLAAVALCTVMRSPQAIPMVFSIGVVFGFSRPSVVPGMAWSRWQINRILLKRRSGLPWHILNFLEDAYQRDLLQIVDLTYQFQYEALHEYFASFDICAAESEST
ncbi:hypothetical protein ACFFQW_17085 [Umezawaea endophytica]|uniref:NACHT domain-containing protein n=1 Tax=Umezawaea endophytica TaxID=1654476 RepID=A0A9X3AH39_9PSEU|nr:hypothetical protein [Umezawaea endophytica]MCS7480466.1 hypothetical protein [Umezawaea endophytica]